MIPTAIRPRGTNSKVEGSGTTVGTIAMLPPSPGMSDAFTTAPEVVYSPNPFFWSVTNRSEPTTAIPAGPLNPVISDAFTVAPDVVYSPTVPVDSFVTNRSEPEIAIPRGLFSPDISDAFTVAPEVVYSP